MIPRTRSLRSKFVFLVVSLVFLVMTLSAVVLVDRERAAAMRSLVGRGRALGLAAGEFVAGRDPLDLATIRPALATLATALGAADLAVRDGEGRDLLPFAAPPRPGAPPRGEAILVDALNDRRFTFTFADDVALRVPCRFAGGQTGEIEARFPLDAAGDSLRSAMLTAALLLFVSLAFGFFMSSFLAGFILKPLNRFIGAAREVAAGEDPQPIERGGGTEIDDLADSFNRMVVHLREKRELEARLTHQDKLATVGQLAAAVAHEVRNPLVSIRSLAELLAADHRGTESERHLGIMIREVDRINAVVERLLNYARPRKRTVEIFDPAQVIEDMALLVKPHARRRDARLRTRFAHRGAVRMGRDDLAQITLNLVLTALTALEPGGAVEIETADEGDRVALLYRDDGRGMDSAARERIFKPFVTGAGGTGLGLTIVEQLVRENGGTIDVESEPGRGTLFTLRFPAHYDRV